MAALPDTFDGPIHVAIIGGTGLSHLPGFEPVASLPTTHPALATPWGAPSSPVTILSHPPLNVAFLSRHGPHHELAPHEVNGRANVAALRRLGVRCVVAFSAVGSLRQEVRPRDFVVPDQVLDWTKGVRPFTFFEHGVVGHVSLADPFDDDLRALITRAVRDTGVLSSSSPSSSGPDGAPPPTLHPAGTLICIEGPQFSTRAESTLYRSWGASVINMSCFPEARLAREAELGYAMICMSTDYDSWHAAGEPVSVAMVMGHMAANAEAARRVVGAVLDALAGADEAVVAVREGRRWAGQTRGAAGMTKREGRPPETVERLEWLLPGYFLPAES